jgi:hypothetical protein
MTEGFHEEVNHPATMQAAIPTIQPSVFSASNVSTSFQSPIAASAERFCIQCGTPNLPESRFCSSCGAKLPEVNLN